MVLAAPLLSHRGVTLAASDCHLPPLHMCTAFINNASSVLLKLTRHTFRRASQHIKSSRQPCQNDLVRLEGIAKFTSAAAILNSILQHGMFDSDNIACSIFYAKISCCSLSPDPDFAVQSLTSTLNGKSLHTDDEARVI